MWPRCRLLLWALPSFSSLATALLLHFQTVQSTQAIKRICQYWGFFTDFVNNVQTVITQKHKARLCNSVFSGFLVCHFACIQIIRSEYTECLFIQLTFLGCKFICRLSCHLLNFLISHFIIDLRAPLAGSKSHKWLKISDILRSLSTGSGTHILLELAFQIFNEIISRFTDKHFYKHRKHEIMHNYA